MFHRLVTFPGGLLRISSDGDDLMGAKIITPQTPWTKNLTPKKSHSEFSSLKNFHRAKQVWLYFIHRFMWPGYMGATMNLHTVLNTPQTPLLKSHHPKKFPAKVSYPKKSWHRKFQTQKRPLIISVTWNLEYPLGLSYSLLIDLLWY